MAKQTFTTGQVLTAAQMTSLQQTAMQGGAASAKTASYTLVAADAGSAISMSNASATTITVNTALFAAGDTVHITNLGAGVCTITAGTATVNSSASLALAQYESGFLDFTSTSAAIFIKGAGAAASSGGMTLISTTTMSGASLALTSIPATYKDLYIVIRNWLPATNGSQMIWSFNQDTTANRHYYAQVAPNENAIAFNNTIFAPGAAASNTVSNNLTTIYIPDYTNTTTWKMARCKNVNVNSANTAQLNHVAYDAYYNQTAAVSSFAVSMASGNMTSGTILLYGVS